MFFFLRRIIVTHSFKKKKKYFIFDEAYNEVSVYLKYSSIVSKYVNRHSCRLYSHKLMIFCFAWFTHFNHDPHIITHCKESIQTNEDMLLCCFFFYQQRCQVALIVRFIFEVILWTLLHHSSVRMWSIVRLNSNVSTFSTRFEVSNYFHIDWKNRKSI